MTIEEVQRQLADSDDIAVTRIGNEAIVFDRERVYARIYFDGRAVKSNPAWMAAFKEAKRISRKVAREVRE